MTTNVIPTTGLEYVISPDGTLPLGDHPGSQTPYSWTSTNISYDSCVPINNFRIYTRYRTVATVPPVPPDVDPTYTITYPNWVLVSQELTSTSHAVSTPGNPFQQTNPYFTATPTDPLTLLGTPLYGPYETPAVAGIVDGSCYDYFKVFDQSESGYLDRLDDFDSEPIEDGVIPTTPYDESVTPPLYPIDALTKFIPDTRVSVTVVYELTTVYNDGLGGNDITDTINISHTVTQSTDDWSTQVKELRERSYFYHGIFPSMPDPRDPPIPIDGTNSDGSHFYP